MDRFKVVMLDFNQSDIPAWVGDRLATAGIDFVARQCKTQAELFEFAQAADVLWVFGGQVITADSLAQLPRCGAIIRSGSGTDNVPVEAATRLGVVVANTPLAHAEAVSDHAIGLLFTLIRQTAAQDRAVRAGEWNPERAQLSWHLRGQTLGLLGFGHIGRLIAQKMRGFEMTVLVYDPYLSPEALEAQGVRAASLEEVLSGSDFISLNCPLTLDTYHLVGERELLRMKPSALLINTARGAVIDEPALVRALTEKWIAGAGLDVLEQEPPATDHPLLALDNVVITPHIGGMSDEHEAIRWDLSLETALALARGHWPRSCVNRGLTPRWNLTERPA